MVKRLFGLAMAILGGLPSTGAPAHTTRRLPREPPAVLAAAAPVFPGMAFSAGLGGDVTVEAHLDASGAVWYAQASGPRLMKDACEVAARRWRFSPDKDGVETRTVQLTFTFTRLKTTLPEENMTPVFYPPYRVEVMHNPKVMYVSRDS